MSVRKAAPAPSRFNYLVCIDIVVLACILVIAGRPDGLAITLTAIIVAIAAVLCRCYAGVKSYLARQPDTAAAAPRQRAAAAPAEPVAMPSMRPSKTASWLRDDD